MPHNDVYLAIDAGGTALKVAAFDYAGREVATGSKVLSPIRPAPGHAERDMDQCWSVIAGLIADVLSCNAMIDRSVRAVGLTGFGNGLVTVDAAGRPVRNAILSSDTRARDLIDEWVSDDMQQKHLDQTHQLVWPGKPLALLKWLQRHEPNVFDRIAYILSCKDYLRFRLTGQFGFEVGDASSGSLINTTTRDVACSVFEALGLGAQTALVPPILETLSPAGAVCGSAADETGLAAGTFVSAGYADGPAMMLGMGAIAEGDLGITSGTWSLNQIVIPEPIGDTGLLGTMVMPTQSPYILVGGSANSAGVLQWVLDNVMLPAAANFAGTAPSDHDVYEWINQEVATVDPCDDIPLFLATLNGEFAGKDLGAGFLGLKSYHTHAHILRSVMEGVVFEHLQQIDRLMLHSRSVERISICGGAAQSQVWMQIFADALGKPVNVTKTAEVGALGAAIVAAVGCGDFPDLPSAVQAMKSQVRLADPSDLHGAAIKSRFQRFQKAKAALTALA